ncbi:Arabinan endo-1,5-alpha-L-arabinosidase A [Talaromyces islandicus]|uniref:Endo-1,5-alpha-L-arabinanase A n=1 Tax=Talaromyces islandicus TaxID=28573 RepID=A0A0U1LXJ6_TALIS|nr:Arabinan endo-1,5-alpha-L-arabinosidase A [Talaromyces islandicus]
MAGHFVLKWLSLALFRAMCISAQDYPLPEPCTGPACIDINGLTYQDFSVIRRESDGIYFRYSKSNETGQGLSVATAPALGGPWNYAFEILTELVNPMASDRVATNVWAPEVHYVNGTYYLFYSINTAPFNFDLCVATSPDMEPDNWTDHGSMNVPISTTGDDQATESYVRLDGNMLADSTDPSGVDGFHYMTFGSYQWGLYGFQVSDDLLTIMDGATVDMVYLEQYNLGEYAGNKTEGPYLLTNNGYVYFFYSIGNCCAADDTAYNDSVYRVQVCRKLVTDMPTGPYLDRDGVDCLNGGVDRAGTTILASRDDGQVFAPGSIGILTDPDLGMVMTYQYWNITQANQDADPKLDGLRFGYNLLSWDSDGWPVLVASS